MKDFGKATLGIVGLAALITWRAYVLSVLWAWFVVSTFGLPLLSVPVAAGILVIMAFTTKQKPLENEFDVKPEPVEAAVTSFAIPLAALGIGWLIKLWM